MNRLALLILITAIPFEFVAQTPTVLVDWVDEGFAAGQAAAGCPGDFDGYLTISTLDLLDFLTLYGTECE